MERTEAGSAGAAPARAGPERREALRGHAAMLLFALAISVSFSLGKRAAPFLPPEAFTAARYTLAAVVLGALAWPLARRVHFAAPWRYLVIGGLFAAYFVLMFEALRLTDAVSVAAIFTLIPLMSAGFGWLLLGQRTSPGALLALVIGGAGAVWVVFRADPAAILAFDLGPGEWLFVLGCASHALYTPVLRKLSRGEPALVFAFGVLLGGFATTLLWGGRTAVAADWGAVPGFVWGTILYLGLVATAVTFLLMRYATLRLPAGKVMAYGYLVPAFVIVWEGLVAGEWVAAPVWLGVGATLAALLVLLHEVD